MPADLTIPATPELLRDWCGPVDLADNAGWTAHIWDATDEEPVIMGECGPEGVVNPAGLLLNLHRPEVVDHLLRWLAGKLGYPILPGHPPHFVSFGADMDGRITFFEIRVECAFHVKRCDCRIDPDPHSRPEWRLEALRAVVLWALGEP